MSLGWARIVAYIAPKDPYAAAYREILEHVGLRVEWTTTLAPGELNRTHVLLLCGNGSLGDYQAELVQDWLNAGGALIASGSGWGISSLLGLQKEFRHMSSGTLAPEREDRLWPDRVGAARFFGAKGHLAGPCEQVAHLDGGRAGITRRHFGRGLAIYLAPHLGQSYVQMQLGRSVETDGIGAEDGTAVLDDGKLRAEDGITLDFQHDREHCAFVHAFADVLKDAWLRAIFQGLEHSTQAVAIPWFWPDHAPAVGALTLDCDNNDVDEVVQVHRFLAMYGVPAAWAIKLPGYNQDVYRTIRAREHEVALLYADEERADWHEERLRSQLTQLVRLASETTLSSVRPIEGSWRGWTRFYELCEAAGARVSMSKGGRQVGTQGFAFGTCHPFFPPRRDGHPGLVAELPYSLYRPGHIASNDVCDRVLIETLERHGCLHVVSHPSCFGDRVALDALRRIITAAKGEHVRFMLPSEIYRWERARRTLRWSTKSIDGELQLALVSESTLSGFSLLFRSGGAKVTVNGREVQSYPLVRYGARFLAIKFDLPAKHQTDVRVHFAGQERLQSDAA